MQDIIDFLMAYPIYTAASMLLNLILVSMLTTRLIIAVNKHIKDARAGRGEKDSSYKKYMDIARQSIEAYERKSQKSNYYQKAVEITRQAGYHGDHAAVIYLLMVYVLPVLAFVLAYAVNFPDYKGGLLLAIQIPLIIRIVISSKRGALAMEFQRSSYKIYKYLHNQISAGVRVIDAIKAVYEVTEDKKLKYALIKLSGTYSSTNDIDYALKDFETYYNTPEAQTLAVALKQGIDTGDNQEILERQEEVMFDKYIDYIQAETDSCKTRSTIAIAFFVVIVVIMISVPMYNDMVRALGQIFIN